MPDTVKMGYQAQILYGAAGSIASGQLGNARDIKYDYGADTDDCTVRGTALLPVKEGRPTALGLKDLSWNMVYKSDDANLTALRAAAGNRTPTPVALRTVTHSGGAGFDGDAFIECSQGMPLNGVQTFDFKVLSVDNSARVATFAS